MTLFGDYCPPQELFDAERHLEPDYPMSDERRQLRRFMADWRLLEAMYGETRVSAPLALGLEVPTLDDPPEFQLGYHQPYVTWHPDCKQKGCMKLLHGGTHCSDLGIPCVIRNSVTE